MSQAEVIAFRACEMTGFPHPDYLVPYLSARQLLDWQRYEREVGSKDDWQWGLQNAILANQHRGKGQAPLQATDMMLWYDPPPLDSETFRLRWQSFKKSRNDTTVDKAARH